MSKIRVMSIFGTRPEAIKMAPVVLELERKSDRFESVTLVTAQHRAMLDQVLSFFGIKPNYDLNIMKQRQTLVDITSLILKELDSIIKQEQPHIVLVHGDTTTAYAAALCAFYNQKSIGHVEAGLRTYNKYSPFPEEMNRHMIDVMSDLYFSPTQNSKMNLIKEGFSPEKIYVTGNTSIDSLAYTVTDNYRHPVLDTVSEKKIILMTLHRRENLGKPMENIFRAIKKVLSRHLNIEFIFPVHPNPAVREIVDRHLKDVDHVHIIEPLDVFDFHNFAAHSFMILTDSGGIQEEAPSLGVPVLVLRDTTERPEGVDAGTLKLVGTDTDAVHSAIDELLTNKDAYCKMSQANNPYGNGTASKKIVDAIWDNREMLFGK